VSDDITLVEKAALSLTEPSRARHAGEGRGVTVLVRIATKKEVRR